MIKRTALSQLMMLSVLSLSIAACTDDDPPAVDSAGTSELAPVDESAPTVSNAFDGNWIDTCELVDTTSAGDRYEVALLTISGATISARVLLYTDSTCQSPDPLLNERLVVASIVYPGGSTPSPQGIATHLDITNESIFYDGQPPTEAQQQGLQESLFFDTRFDLALIENGMLFFGDNSSDNDGTSAELRPTILDDVGLAMQ